MHGKRPESTADTVSTKRPICISHHWEQSKTARARPVLLAQLKQQHTWGSATKNDMAISF
jgi:hypothetical protein